jgi:hypothetical protein
MNPQLSEDARSFGEVASGAFDAAGGVDLARRAEADPASRSGEVSTLLDRLGVGDIDARANADAAEAAAALCRAAGRVVLPYPIVSIVLGGLALTAQPATDGPGAAPRTAMVDHGDLLDHWRLASLDGTAAAGVPDGTRLGTRLGPFVGAVRAGDAVPVSTSEIALHLALTGFVIAGALSAALELATAHVIDRVQFDKPLSSFQAVQFQLADAHVAVASVDELVQFSLWRCLVAPGAALVDALAARLGALDAARSVLRTAQQLHGAAGVCDEYDISVIVRHLQPAMRLPFGAETTASHLVGAVAEQGFEGLFDHGGAAT